MPSRAFVGEPIWGGLRLVYLPYLGLSIRVATNPVIPPTKWTGPSPAISTIPHFLRKPLLSHTQWAGKQKTRVFRREKAMYASSFVLSAMAPVKERRYDNIYQINYINNVINCMINKVWKIIMYGKNKQTKTFLPLKSIDLWDRYGKWSSLRQVLTAHEGWLMRWQERAGAHNMLHIYPISGIFLHPKHRHWYKGPPILYLIWMTSSWKFCWIRS